MNSISILNLGTAILGFLISMMLIFSADQNRFVNRFLGLAFLPVAYRSLTLFFLQNDLVENTFLMGSISIFYYCLAPAFFIYFRSVINDEQSLRKKDWMHLIIPAMALLLLAYYIVMGYVQHGEFRLPLNQDAFNETKDYPLHILPKYHVVAISFIYLVYLLGGWRLLVKKLGKKAGEHPQVRKVRVWILTLLITCSLLLCVIFYHASLLLVFKADVKYAIQPDIIRTLILVFIFSRVLLKRDLLIGIPRINTALPVVDQVVTPLIVSSQVTAREEAPVPQPENEEAVEAFVELQTEGMPYFDNFGWIHLEHLENESDLQTVATTAPIEKDKVIVYIRRINEFLAREPFTDPLFDMKSISAELQYPLYHIEFLFRYYNKHSFSEFRNIMRVQFVLKEFESGNSHNYTMEGLGLKAGFNSRSSFFRVFKTVTGNTPKQFLESFEEKRV
jgi:AraC-like DNA-binding protein